MSVTRDEVLKYVKYICKRDFQVHEAEIIAHICEYVEQDPDPGAALWAEIKVLLKGLSEHDPENFWELVCNTDTPSQWQVATRQSGMSSRWTHVGQNEWVDLQTIRDQLHKLATERGLLTPSLDDMQVIVGGLLSDGDNHIVTAGEIAQLKAYFAAQDTKGKTR